MEKPKNAICAKNTTNKSSEAYIKLKKFFNSHHKEKCLKLHLNLVFEYFDDDTERASFCWFRMV